MSYSTSLDPKGSPADTMNDSTVAQLLSIPDPDAASFNPANGVRRSMRAIKSRGPQPDFVDHEASMAEEFTEAITSIAPEGQRSAAKRLHSPAKLRAKPTTSHHTEAPETPTPVESEITRLESPLKKTKLTNTTRFSSRHTVGNTETREDESVAGEADEESVPVETETSGPPKTPQLKTHPIILASPQLSDESGTPSPKRRGGLAAKLPKRASTKITKVGTGSLKKRGSLTAKPPKRTSTKIAKAESSETAHTTVDPVDGILVVRPPPHGKPEVWAEGRQALCETLPYYRAYQSGAYTHDLLVYGFLLDRDCGERGFMDEEVVITRAGGGCTVNEDGDMQQSKDQKSTGSSVTSMWKNKEYQVPIPLIVGDKNETCPSTIPHPYCVMDWFHVTDIWAEKSNGKICFKFRFEKCDLATKSWWAAEGTPDPPKVRDFNTKTSREVCISCMQESPQIFQQSWICLNEECSEFWKIDGEAPADLLYDDRFLRERTAWPRDIKPPFSLKPALLEADLGNDPTYGFSRVCWKGMACPKCGRCSSREHWKEWVCGTKGCGFTYSVKQSILSARAVLDGHEVEFLGHAFPQDTFTSTVTEQVTLMDNWRLHTYNILPGNVVTHFSANNVINKRPGGPDDMFVALQGVDMSLQRFPLQSSGLRGANLTNHFAVNFGMPYKYVVKVDSKPFAEAPKTILDALRRLTWAGQKTVSDGTFQPFNELLTLGYFEEQKIGFHDDGESTLGPTIATLSLGGQATMVIRMKPKYYHGFTKAGKYSPLAPVLPGCKDYDKRVELNAQYGKISEKAFEGEKARLFPKKGRRKGTPPHLLTMQLNHGDMIVMSGADMQKYYEHAVYPSGKLRFALTCRYVRPEAVDVSDHWRGDYVTEPGAITAYDGDENAAANPAEATTQSPADWTMVDARSDTVV